MAILAMKCLKDRSGPVDPLVAGISTRQIAYVKGKQEKDGGFDDLISTSIAVQVKMQFHRNYFWFIPMILRILMASNLKPFRM